MYILPHRVNKTSRFIMLVLGKRKKDVVSQLYIKKKKIT
jgi:hypothetical protein